MFKIAVSGLALSLPWVGSDPRGWTIARLFVGIFAPRSGSLRSPAAAFDVFAALRPSVRPLPLFAKKWDFPRFDALSRERPPSHGSSCLRVPRDRDCPAPPSLRCPPALLRPTAESSHVFAVFRVFRVPSFRPKSITTGLMSLQLVHSVRLCR